MLEHGHNAHSRDEDGLTPLHYTVASKKSQIVQLIQQQCADRNAIIVNGLTPPRLIILYDLKNVAACYIRDAM